MAIRSGDIEVTKEFLAILQEIERGKFHTFDKLYEKSCGSPFDDKTEGETCAVIYWSQWIGLRGGSEKGHEWSV